MPLIISTDKTQLTVFGNKTAYPVYLTIGNIPKAIRRKPSRQAQILIAYLPTTKLDSITNATSRRRAQANLFHACMGYLLDQIRLAALTGIAMCDGHGIWRRCYPILACYVADNPEQALVTGSLSGDCVIGTTPWNRLGDTQPCKPRMQADIQSAIYSLADGNATAFHLACKDARLRPIYHPFWQNLPFCNIYTSITPDVLHQLYQGVVKHLISWLTDPSVFGPDEINARCRRMPPNHHTRIFTQGITHMQRPAGVEFKDICRILMGLIIDLPLSNNRNPAPVIRAVRGILDFLAISQYSSITSRSLDSLDKARYLWEENRYIFVDLGVRSNFHIPKFHSLMHWRQSIEMFGTTDNYNTEQTERLHIDLAKNAYRKTNKKEATAQMTVITERIEKLQHHSDCIEWLQREAHHLHQSAEGLDDTRVQMTKWKSASVPFLAISELYGATSFSDALADFVIRHTRPGLALRTARSLANDVLIPHHPVAVFHKVRFQLQDSMHSEDDDGDNGELDVVHARPQKKGTNDQIVPARFDTALAIYPDAAQTAASTRALGVQG
jgi:hypothetical protein